MAGVGDGGGGGWENNASPGRRECAAAGPTRDRENPDVQASTVLERIIEAGPPAQKAQAV